MQWQDLVTSSRLETMKSAIDLLSQWQEATYRLPLLENTSAFFQEKERLAAMLVDHHLGKLARKVRMLGANDDIDSLPFLDEWAEIAFMIDLWRKFDGLSDGMKLNLIYQSGPNISRKHLSRETVVTDVFVVMGVEFSNEELLRQRSVYLYGLNASRYFVVIEYAFSQQPFDRPYEVGSWMEGDVICFPFPGSLRISPVELQARLPKREWFSKIPVATVPDAVKSFYSLLRVNPFGVPFPVRVELCSDFSEGQWRVTDRTGRTIRLARMEAGKELNFYAICFRRMVRFTVLINREGFRPLSYFNGENFFAIENLEGELVK